MDLQRVDLTSQQFKRNPFPEFARLAGIGPLVRTRLPLFGKLWLTTTYEAADRVLRDHDAFVQEPARAGRALPVGLSWWMPRSLLVLTKNMLGRDEPDHRRLRSLVEQAFLRLSVEQLRPRIAVLADRFLDDLESAARDEPEGADFIRHFARPFPLAVICELLGLPADDRSHFMRWASALSSAQSVPGMFSALLGIRRIQKYLKMEFQRCRERPRTGLISELVAVEQEGDRLSEDELLAMVFLLLFAGHETTVHLLSGGLLALLEHPEEKARLIADWSKVGSAVDEMLRFVSPVQSTKPRYAIRDVTLFDQQLRRGEVILPLLAAANADPKRFDQPTDFRIDRSPNPHLGFGRGIHTCLGMKLAKTEAEIAFETIFTRCPMISLAVPASELAWTSRLGLRALVRLPVAFR